MIDHLDLAIAAVIVAALAWDIARRKLKPPPPDDYAARFRAITTRVDEQDALLEQIAADGAQNAAVTRELGIDWLKKFAELQAGADKRDKDLATKVGGAIANLPSRGYNR